MYNSTKPWETKLKKNLRDTVSAFKSKNSFKHLF